MPKIVCLVLLLTNCCLLYGNDSTYLARQEAYIDVALQTNSGHPMTLQAFRGVPLDEVELNELLIELPSKFDPDFQVVELIRILFYADGLYDDHILPVLDQMPFWLNDADTTRNYWTENHMIMWMSSEWLLHERYNRPVDEALYPRLVHYLELKRDYGFYEFFSSVYFPYTLSGLLNLYEFSEDLLVKELAGEVAQRLLKEMLIPATDMGVYYPVAGRNYPEKYNSAYGQNHSSLIYLLTGFGEVPDKASHAGAFLATSTLAVDHVISSWRPRMDSIFHVGHSLESSFEIHSEMSATDRLIFQWSSSAYAHPSIVQETFQVLGDSSLWDHKDWMVLEALSIVSPEDAPGLAETLNVLSYSSQISDYDVRIFKNDGIALMSVPELWKGRVGFQQWPVAATVGTTAVFTQSGEVTPVWWDRDPTIENTHLPHVEQKSNVALVMYRPAVIPAILDLFAGDMFDDKEVALFWKEDDYDEIIEDGNWLLARQNENYVAVRRSCTEIINSWWACDTNNGQTWVIMVGDASMYTSFENFQNIIAQSEFTEEWSVDPQSTEDVYYAQIIVDTLSVSYTWGGDSTITNVQNPISSDFDLNLFPNPCQEFVTIDFRSDRSQSIDFSIFNSIGQEIHAAHLNAELDSSTTIRTANWKEGMYFVVFEVGGKKYHQKIVKF